MTYRNEVDALHAKNEALERELRASQRELARLRALQDHRGPDERGAGPPSYDDGDRIGARMALIFGLVMVMMTSMVAGRALSTRARPDYAGYGGWHDSPCARFADVAGAYAPASPRFVRGAERTGRVSNVLGAAPVASDARCAVRVLPSSHPRYNCRVEVQCGDTMLYGEPGAGYTRCALDAGLPVRAHDAAPSHADGDGRIEMDLGIRSVVVSDERDGHTYAVGLTLDPES